MKETGKMTNGNITNFSMNSEKHQSIVRSTIILLKVVLSIISNSHLKFRFQKMELNWSLSIKNHSISQNISMKKHQTKSERNLMSLKNIDWEDKYLMKKNYQKNLTGSNLVALATLQILKPFSMVVFHQDSGFLESTWWQWNMILLSLTIKIQVLNVLIHSLLGNV